MKAEFIDGPHTVKLYSKGPARFLR